MVVNQYPSPLRVRYVYRGRRRRPADTSARDAGIAIVIATLGAGLLALLTAVL